jgi:hypothetical protein
MDFKYGELEYLDIIPKKRGKDIFIAVETL